LLAAHLLALYWPRVDLAGMPPDSDKLGHALLFGLPALAALLTLARRWAGVAVGALTVHAPVSEWLQAAVLPSRSGDLRDAVADLVGVLAGAVIGWAWARRLERGPPAR
jgi:VanZ family protein